jgi:UPF0716 protein FxsA
MNVAKWFLLAVLMLPAAELAAFIAVAVGIGFLGAAALILAGSFAGAMILRHAGGNHIARMRSILDGRNFTTLQADGTGAMLLVAGFLLLIPGFITDTLALLLLVAPLRRIMGATLWRGTAPQRDGVVDLEPEQWRRVPDPSLPPRGEDRDRD